MAATASTSSQMLAAHIQQFRRTPKPLERGTRNKHFTVLIPPTPPATPLVKREATDASSRTEPVPERKTSETRAKRRVVSTRPATTVRVEVPPGPRTRTTSPPRTPKRPLDDDDVSATAVPIPRPRRTTATPRRSLVDSDSDDPNKSADADEYTAPLGSWPTTAPKSAKKKRTSPKRPYADPSVYGNLNGLTDHLAPNLEVVFCGFNPGVKSATDSHHFAHRSNHFWRCMHRGGLTGGVFVPPTEDATIVERFKLGLTNLVERPSAQAAELSNAECRAAVPRLLAKFIRDRPKVVCFVGMGIWAHFQAAIKAGMSKDQAKRFKLANVIGLQKLVLAYPAVKLEAGAAVEKSKTYLFVSPSTSGLVTQYQLPDKIASFASLQSLREQVVKDGSLELDGAVEIDAAEWYTRWRAEQGDVTWEAGTDSAEFLRRMLDQG